MFGLVLRSRLLEAERRVVKLKLLLQTANEGQRSARTALSIVESDLRAEKQLRQRAEAEVERLHKIIYEDRHDEGEAEPAQAKPAEQPSNDIPRVLTGIEVVARATRHRNVHNKAAER